MEMESFPVVISDIEIIVCLKSLMKKGFFFVYPLTKVDRLLPINLFKVNNA